MAIRRVMYGHIQLVNFSLCLLFLPAAATLAQSTTTQELYVKPTVNTPCPGPCYTLDEYVQNASQYFVSKTTFNFLPGNHKLTWPLSVSNVTNLALVAVSGTVNITCHSYLSVSFTEIFNLTLENLTINTCGTLFLTDLLHLHLEISVQPIVNVSIQMVILIATNILGISSIDFHIIAPADLKPLDDTLQTSIFYNDKSVWPIPVTNQLTITDSSLLLPRYDEFAIQNYIMQFWVEQSSYGVNLLLDNLNFVHYMNILIDIGSAVPNNTVLVLTQVTIVNTLIANGAGLSVSAQNGVNKAFVMNNVTFTTNIGTKVLYLSNVANMTIIDCKFINTVDSDSFSAQQAVVWMENCSNVSFNNCEFNNNGATPIAAFDSTFTLSGWNNFTNNIAPEGSAMALYGQSYVTLANGSDILFSNNSAETVGGAIYVDYDTNSPCFFVLEGEYWCPYEVYPYTLPVTMRFSGNVAENGGNIIYGASLDTCQVVNNNCNGWNFVNSLFHIDQRNGSLLSAITSDPLRVCLCDADGKPSCDRLFSNLTVFPGEPFSVSAVVVGDRFGTVDGSVYAQLLPLYGPYIAELGNLEWSQRVRHFKCANLSYTVFSNSSVALSLVLTTSSARVQNYPDSATLNQVETEAKDYERTGYIDSLLRTFPVFINITLLPCPLGFMLSGEPYQCVCDIRLQESNIHCNLTMQTVQRSGTDWINASFHKKTYSGVIVNKYCPNNYCKPETVSISMERPDSQCAFNHSGILCGGCQSGLSLALGSSQCLYCSNKYLALLAPFFLAGFALVFFIKVLNLTVAKGTLDGLIFYANIVRANQDAWIPAQDRNVLTVFIAWLNLDLGIQTCFFNGLDAYWKTWLQFVFPLYIWAIAILIIVLSHYSSTAAKIFGRNSVPVLATLFLLSYPKLLRTIIFIFDSSTLDYPDGTSAIVWSHDGNIPYFSAKRIPLLLVALMVLVFLWLPYTGVLLCAQCLHSSNYRVARLLLKLKPFLDAYFGPLKDKHRYWVGLLLLVRGALFVIYAATPTSMAGIDLLATGIAIVSLLIYPDAGHVYQKTHLNILQNSFLFNLCILVMGTFYIQVSGGSQAALAYTSVGIAFAVFLAVVVFHALASFTAIRWANELANRYFNNQNFEQDQGPYEQMPDEPQIRELHTSCSQYREPMLRYLDDQ